MDNRLLIFPTDFKKDENDIWVQQKYSLELQGSKEGDTPICLRRTDKLRLFDSLDFSSLLRFWIAINWMQKQFKKEKKKIYRVLDLGCANLQAYHIWHNNGNYFGWPQIRYYGVDVNYKRMMTGKREYDFKRSDSVTLINANLEHPIIFRNEKEKLIKFDFAVCMEFLEHIPKECFEIILKNMVKTQLRKEGTAILSSPNPDKEHGEEVVWKKFSPISHVYERSWAEAEKIILDSGLKVLEKASVLSRSNYRSIAGDSQKKVRDRMNKFLPASVVNNVMCLSDDVMKGRQWVTLVSRK